MTTVRELALIGVPEDVAGPLLQYIDALNAADIKRTADRKWGRFSYFDVDKNATGGGKYLRVVSSDDEAQTKGRSVHSFVVKADGRVVKPAGWNAPAKSLAKGREGELLSQYTLTDPASLTDLLALLDKDTGQIHGGYLYQR